MRVVALFPLLLPTAGFAEWSPSPNRFSYAAAFEACTMDPTASDLVGHCEKRLEAAFVLSRAVVQATQACLNEDLAFCATPFEDAGLPAIAANIAAGTGCENTDLSQHETDDPLPEFHCAALISDILQDEGVVPLEGMGDCAADPLVCEDLRQVHASYWYKAIFDLSDTDLTRQRSDAAWNTCIDAGGDTAAIENCHIAALANIWIDLTRAALEDN